MVYHMKTTLNIDDSVMRRLREEAARRGRSMSELVEAGIRLVLAERPEGEAELPELPVWRSGGARVDVAHRESLYDLMEG
jgi:Arc/MetJ-type ribon-helix-helix transcriptional regulator